jgi:TonB-linked SusC/RagA family outer membrane protein
MKKNKVKDHCGTFPLVRKGFLIMRLFLVLMTLGVLHSTASVSQTKRFNLNEKDISVKEILSLIEKQSEFRFFYEEDKLNVNEKLSISISNSTIEEVLDQLLSQTGIEYKLMDNNFVVLKSGVKVDHFNAAQQNKTVIGKVTDTAGEPIPGATVSVKGTSQGTITDVEGKYSLKNIPGNAVLVFSFVGMGTQELEVADKTILDVVMKEETVGIDEVVAIGYGSVRKSELSSSIATVSNADIAKTPIRSLEQALQGNAAGVLVVNASGEPGGDIAIRIRGGSSLNADNEPLVVIDGYPLDNSALSMISPNDIQSMEILKDASATAIYGSRGANGVIMVTTKNGVAGKTKIDIQGNIQIAQPRRFIPMLDGPQFKKYDEISRYVYGQLPGTFRPDTVQTVDYMKQLFKDHALYKDFSLQVSGGDKKTNYMLSANYLGQEGLIYHSSFDRYSFMGKLNTSISSKINLSVGFNTSYSKKDQIGGGDSGATYRTLTLRPDGGMNGKFENGLFIDEETGEILSSNSEISKSLETLNRSKTFRTQLTGSLDWSLSKNLVLTVRGGFYYDSKPGYLYTPRFIYLTQANVDKNNKATRRYSSSFRWNNENTLTYSKVFSARHNLNLMLGQSWEGRSSEDFSTSVRSFEVDNFSWNNLGAGLIVENPSSSLTESSMISFFGRTLYNYDRRYFLTFTMRADGSSRFGKDSKFGYFPSASFAWRAGNEQFIKKLNIFSDLKFRFSYGLTGNDKIGEYRSLTTLNSESSIIGGNVIGGFVTSTMGNEDLKWEKTEQTNLGLDMGFLEGRITMATDYYYKKTNDLLYSKRLPLTSGYSSVVSNVGTIRNSGIELELTSKNLVGKFTWTTSLNLGYNKSKVIDLGGDDNFSLYYLGGNVKSDLTFLIIGEPLGTFLGYQLDGVFKDWNDVYSENSTWAETSLPTQPGMLKYVDQNNDGVINNDDRIVLGHAQPDLIGGFTNTFSYKNFDLTIFINGVYGNSVINTNRTKIEEYRGGSNNQVKLVMDGWRPINPETGDPGYTDASRPVATYSKAYVNLVNSDWVEDGSYLRLKTLTLGYNLPNNLLNRIKIRSCRMFLSGINLVTLTKYSGFDPENSSSQGTDNTRMGIDLSSYPASKIYTIGLNIGL